MTLVPPSIDEGADGARWQRRVADALALSAAVSAVGLVLTIASHFRVLPRDHDTGRGMLVALLQLAQEIADAILFFRIALPPPVPPHQREETSEILRSFLRALIVLTLALSLTLQGGTKYLADRPLGRPWFHVLLDTAACAQIALLYAYLSGLARDRGHRAIAVNAVVVAAGFAASYASAFLLPWATLAVRRASGLDVHFTASLPYHVVYWLFKAYSVLLRWKLSSEMNDDDAL